MLYLLHNKTRTKMTTETKTAPIKADVRKTTHLLKKELKRRFGITASVRTESYSGGSSINISYTFGAYEKEVESFCSNLQYGNFNSMEDIYEYNKSESLVIEGYELEQFKYVFVKQEIPSSFKYQLAKMISDTIKFTDVPEITSEEDYNNDFKTMLFSAWNWTHKLFRVKNFVTQDESKIVLKSVNWSETNNFTVYFIYEVDGKEYSTETSIEKK